MHLPTRASRTNSRRLRLSWWTWRMQNMLRAKMQLSWWMGRMGSMWWSMQLWLQRENQAWSMSDRRWWQPSPTWNRNWIMRRARSLWTWSMGRMVRLWRWMRWIRVSFIGSHHIRLYSSRPNIDRFWDFSRNFFRLVIGWHTLECNIGFLVRPH